MSIATEDAEAVQEQIQARLDALKKELETGQAELQKVEAQRIYLHETMLRISGAVQALEELLAEGGPGGPDGTVTNERRIAATDEEPGAQRAKT